MFVKDVIRTTKTVRDNGADPGHTWSYMISKIMRDYYLWYDIEDWAQTSLLTRCSHVLLMSTTPVLWTCVFIAMVQNASEMEISKMAERISLTMGGCLTSYHFVQYHLRRRALTTIIRMVNEKMRSIYDSADRNRNEKICKRISEQFVVEGNAFAFAGTLGCAMVVLSQAIVPLTTGELAYDTILPLNKTSYSPEWWIEYIYQSVTVLIAIYFYTCKEMLMFDIYLQMSLVYEKIAIDLQNLCSEESYNDDVEYQKLRNIFKEAQEVHEIGTKMQEFMSTYMFLWHFAATLMLAISGFSFMLEMKHGLVQAIVKNISYPLYVLVVLFLWSTLAEYYTKSARETGLAAFHCNWTGTTRRFRFLLLLYLTKTTVETEIKGSSFYVVKMETMADILKKTYYFMALLRDILN